MEWHWFPNHLVSTLFVHHHEPDAHHLQGISLIHFPGILNFHKVVKGCELQVLRWNYKPLKILRSSPNTLSALDILELPRVHDLDLIACQTHHSAVPIIDHRPC